MTPITQEQLVNNGFYKYSSQYLPEIHEKVNNDTTSAIKFELYSNVKPEKNDENQLCPTQLWHFNREDSIKKKEIYIILKMN